MSTGFVFDPGLGNPWDWWMRGVAHRKHPTKAGLTVIRTEIWRVAVESSVYSAIGATQVLFDNNGNTNNVTVVVVVVVVVVLTPPKMLLSILMHPKLTNMCGRGSYVWRMEDFIV